MRTKSHGKTEASTNRRTFSRRPLVVSLMVVLVTAAVASSVFAAADGNPVQEILTIVQGIQATLTGTGGSLAALQSDVTAIKAKTDNLPENIDVKLRVLQASVDDIKAATGPGPLNKFYTRKFTLAQGHSHSVTCTSTGPYRLHLTVLGADADFQASLNGSFVFGEHLDSLRVSSADLGGNAPDVITIQGSVALTSGARIFILIVMQTTEGASVGCT